MVFRARPRHIAREGSSASEEIADELRRLLFATIIPMTIIGISTVCFAVVLGVGTGTTAFFALAACAAAASGGRIACVLGFRHTPHRFELRTWERLYALCTFAFSLVLATFAIAAHVGGDSTGLMMAVILIVSYCAGIVARASVRPKIAITNVFAAAIPLALAIGANGQPEDLVMAMALLVIIAGSINTIGHTHRITREHLVTRRRFAELAAYDPLTKLPNRSMVMERLDEIFSDPRTGLVAIHFIDLDFFKAINDTRGHHVGDQILQAVAGRLADAIVGSKGIAARFGGDEFLVVQPDTDEIAAAALAERLVALFKEPVLVDGEPVTVAGSNGCQLVDPRQAGWRTAVEHADRALYEAKHRGRGQAVLQSADSALAA